MTSGIFTQYNSRFKGIDYSNQNSYVSNNAQPYEPMFNFSSTDMTNRYGDQFFSPFNNYGMGFGNKDFTTILLEQQAFLAKMFTKTPNSFDISIPNFAGLKQKRGSVRLSAAACKKIEEISKKLNCNPNDLKALIYSESGGNPQAVNRASGASGLIQFMPKTAAGLGTSVQAIRKMTAEQQLVYVEQYLLKAKKHAGFDANHKLTGGELYAMVFMPAKANKDVMCRAGSTAYNQNRGLDRNHDGVITKEEMGARLAQYHNYAKNTKA